MIKKWIAGLLTLSLVLGLMTGLTLTASADTPTIEQTLDCSGWWSAHTTGVPITEEGIEITFTNTTYPNTTEPAFTAANHNGPLWILYTGTEAKVGGAGYAEYWVERGDLYGWAGSALGSANTNSMRDVYKLGATHSVVSTMSDTWLSGLQSGAQCSLIAQKVGGYVYVNFTVNGATSSVSIPFPADKTAYISLSGEKTKLTNIQVNTLSYSPATALALGATVESLNCSSWWTTFTNGVEITEAGVDISFTNTSGETVRERWNGPTLVMYSGRDAKIGCLGYAEYWVQRCDNWGWGTGVAAGNDSATFAESGVTYNTVFTNSFPGYDNNAFVNQLKAGVDCTVSAWKSDSDPTDKLQEVTYVYSVCGVVNTVTLSVPAGLPVYISLTGDVTTLSNIKPVAHTHTPGAVAGDCKDLPCTICGKATGTGAANHTFTYTASGAVITESCSVTGCTAHTATATITAPTSPVDDGTTEHKATVAYSDDWKGGELDITYSPSAPVAAGEYTASITVGGVDGVTASVSYEVSNHTHAYTYALNSDRTVITETCTVAGCDHEKTATISAPTGTLTADGTTEFAANVVYEEGWAGEKPAIAYTVDTVATTDLTKGGAYEASITVDGMKAHVTYNVHAHNYIYAASGNKITQSCSCGHSATATVNAPTGTLYAGSNHNATVACDSKWVGEKPTVTHTLGGKTVTATNVVGKYTASITVGDKTASVNFEVIERPADTLPDLDGTGWWTAHTEGVKITEAGVEITFTNTTYATATGNWNGPLWILYHNSVASVGGDNYAEYWVERGDLYGWAGAALKTYKNFTGDVDTGDNAANLTSVGVTHEVTANVTDWAAWLTEMKAGADCKIVAKRDGANIVVTFVANDAATKVTVPFPADQDAYISLTAELAKLTNIKVVALESDNTGDTDTGDTGTGDTDTGDTGTGDTGTGDTDTGDTGTGDTDTGNTDSGNTDSGDTGNNGPTNTVLPDVDSPAFWGSHSAGQEITADGFDITFTSTSYADISNNWEGPMYILFAGDEPKVNGAGYTELWVQRGDNYGWIDGKNNLDHMADLNALGITYESSCADWDALWADYVANLKKGCEVKIHAELKDGKAVVTMTVQGLTMTTSVPVPEGKTVYLAVSGEKTKLTDINVKTGDPIAVVFALMVASAAGIVVLKKKEF